MQRKLRRSKYKKLIPPITYLVFFGTLFPLSVGLIFWTQVNLAYAQENVGSYTVVAGDTLSAISQRYGIPLEVLVEFNNIEDPSLIQVGQILLIPSPDASAALNQVETVSVSARPGETLLGFARRNAQEPSVLSALNSISQTVRLFPGQPIQIPGTEPPPQPLRYGSVLRVNSSPQLIQGKTGRIFVESSRPLSLTASWNGLPVTFTPVPATLHSSQPFTESVSIDAQVALSIGSHRSFALLPVPALIAPGSYPLTLTYIARNGVALNRSWSIAVVDGEYPSQVISLPDDKGGLLAPEIVRAEIERLSAVWLQISPTLYWQDKFILPIAPEFPTTSIFGIRRSYNGGPYNSYHAGQDFGAPGGTIVTAPAPGVVVMAEPLQVRGNVVIVDHGRGIFTGYWHLSEIKANMGQTVAAGEVIGLVGTTGLSTGAHLHWELRIYGIGVDPMQFLGERVVELPSS